MPHLKLWIDPAGVPLAAELQAHVELGMFLMRFRTNTTEKNSYQVAGGRLIRSRHERDEKTAMSMLGEQSVQSVTTVEPLP